MVKGADTLHSVPSAVSKKTIWLSLSAIAATILVVAVAMASFARHLDTTEVTKSLGFLRCSLRRKFKRLQLVRALVR
jgi:hypothetical protein